MDRGYGEFGDNMGKYDFDTVTDRRGTFSEKWDVEANELPMWVADMDFKTAPEIIEALEERVSHGIFGYTYVPDEWNRAYVDWWKEHHGFTMDPDWLIFTTGVIPAISTTVRKITTPAEKVLIQTPVYNIFYNCILNNGRVPVESKLLIKDGHYEMDFEDLEKKLSDPQVTLMLLCNPQNPSGTIWDKETLSKLGELCKKCGVTVLSDEIHCDITDPGFEYVPFASVSDTCRDISITCISATKCFNMAGLHSAAVSVPNKFLRHKIWRSLNTDEVAEPNAFAVQATIAAFTKGEPWLKELREYIYGNKKLVDEFIAKNLPETKAVMGHATYLYWLDVRKIAENSDRLADFIRKETGLYISKGSSYGPGGEEFLRINLACPRAVVEDGLERLKKGIDAYKNA